MNMFSEDSIKVWVGIVAGLVFVFVFIFGVGIELYNTTKDNALNEPLTHLIGSV